MYFTEKVKAQHKERIDRAIELYLKTGGTVTHLPEGPNPSAYRPDVKLKKKKKLKGRMK